MFGVGPSSQNTSLIQLDVSLLSAHFQAQLAMRGGGTAMAGISKADSTPPAKSTPWDQPEDERPLDRRIAELKSTRSFIDPNSSEARLAGENKDAKALFTLYEALVKLKAIADYAAEANRTESSRAPLDVLMQKGLAEIQGYLQTAALDKLDLVYGNKSNRVETEIGVGKNQSKFIGRGLQTSSRDAAIPGLSGNETFTLTIGKSGTTQDFTIDLSEISGPISLKAIADLANAKIEAVTTTDALGATVPKYTTRFNVEKIDDTHYALALSGLTGETVSLSAAVPEPSLFVVGTTKATGSNATTTGTFTRVDGVAGDDPARAFRDSIAGDALALKEVPKEEVKDDPLNGRTNATVEKIRQQVADLYKELDITKTDTATRPAAETTAAAVAVDSEGHVFVIGTTEGDMGNDINRADGGDVYLSKLDAAGNVIWRRLLGASGDAAGYGLAIDSEDNVIVAGSVNGTLDGSELFKGTDSFVTKFSNSGDQLWTQQLDSYAEDSAFAVTVDSDNTVYVTGRTAGLFQGGLAANGGDDAYVAQLSGTKGTILAATQFGTAGSESGKAIAVADDGNILVATEEDGRAIVRKLDKTNLATVLWSADLGALGGGTIAGMAVEGNNIYLAGSSGNAGFGGGAVTAPQHGAQDGFVLRLDDAGASASVAWTNFVGTASGDSITGLSVSGGQVYVAGRTSGQLGADSKSGVTDAFVGKIDGATGATAWTEQLGGLDGYNGATGVAFSATGSSVLTKLGLGPGAVQVTETRNLQTQTTLRPGDYFYLSVNGGTKQKVAIRDGDTFERLASRINQLSFRNVKAEVSLGTSAGRKLKITAINGGEIKIMAGDGDKDALRSLGLQPTTILSQDKLFGTDGANSGSTELGGMFGLKFEAGLTASTERGAKYLSGKLGDALAQVQRAYRSLYRDPLAEMLKQQAKATSGTVPAYLQKQLANYQDGLVRLSGGFIA